MKKVTMAIIAVLWAASPAAAHSFTKGDITVAHPWTRATPAGAPVGVGYLKITNKGQAADVLTGGTFEGATSVEIHEMKSDGDRMSMRQLKDGLEVKPGETIELKPLGTHLMLLGLTKPVAQGPNVKGSLTFKNAGSVDVEFKVEPIGATQNGAEKP